MKKEIGSRPKVKEFKKCTSCGKKQWHVATKNLGELQCSECISKKPNDPLI